MECHRELGCSEEELRAMLSRHLDGELSGPEAGRVEDHLKECGRCRDEVASLRGVDRTVRHSVESTRASEGFVRRVMSAISGRHASAGAGGRAVPRAVVWGVAAVLAIGAAALIWIVISWLLARPPQPLRELGLAMPASVPGLEGAAPKWRVRRSGKRRRSDVAPGGRVAAGTELELGAGGGPGAIDRADGLRVHCAPGARFVVGPAATDEGGLSLADGRVLVTLAEGAGRFELGLLDPPRLEDLPGPAVALGVGPASVLAEVQGGVAVVTVVSGKATLGWATGARDLARRERAEVTDAGGARDVTVVDLRALDLGFAPPGLRVSPWPQVGGSAAREGRSPFEFTLPPKKALDLGTGAGAAGPVIGPDGTVYVLAGPAPGRLLGLRGGKVAAAVALDEAPVGAPAVAPDGTVLVATRSGFARASSDLARVAAVVALGPGDMPRAGPTVAPGGDVYLVLGAALAAFARDGAALWRRDDIRSGSPPSVGPDGTVHVAAISGKLHALDPATGEDRAPASMPVDEPFLAHAAVAPDGTAYAVSARRYLTWRGPGGKSGRVALPVSEYVLAPAIMPSGEVVVASSGGVVHRLGPRPTEAPAKPFFEAGERIARGPVVDAGGRVAVWTASGRLVVVEPNGRSNSWDLGAEESSAAAVSRDGALLFVTRGGAFFGK
ncbi:MAG: zf-HC2 domain-containing protein [Planctomycetota bacterium]|jgi:outer membrane protein assembly factor BamB